MYKIWLIKLCKCHEAKHATSERPFNLTTGNSYDIKSIADYGTGKSICYVIGNADNKMKEMQHQRWWCGQFFKGICVKKMFVKYSFVFIVYWSDIKLKRLSKVG